AMAMARNRAVVKAFIDDGHEIACHGMRWIHYQDMSEPEERRYMELAIEQHTCLTGEPPLGWYTGRDSPNTRRLVVEQGGFEYDSDYYGDDLPFWTTVTTRDGVKAPHLVVPYTLEANDMRFTSPQGFNSGEQFFQYLKDSFDVLYEEGEEAPKMMSVGLHCRIAGRPGRFRALQRFLDYIEQHDRVWVCRRIDIARHWKQVHPYQPD
ncbi:MAG TPA: allantoinase, partial [Marinobacter sp.]|nr:allantoinase [Marinobacter sp.]